MPLKFSIIIPCYNEEKHISACLESIFAMDYPNDQFEVIVVDNGSTDLTREIISQYPVTLLRDDHKNVSGLRNLGAAHAAGEILAFVDADCIVSMNWLMKAQNYFERRDVAAWGAPPVIPENATWVQKTWFLVRRKKEDIQEVEWLESMNLFVRKALFLEINGFNESLVTCEDVDLSYRLGKYGKIVSDSSIEVVHLGDAATVAAFLKKEIWRGAGNVAGIKQHGLSVKELPSVAIPFYFAFFVPMLLLISVSSGSAILWTVSMLSLISPTAAVFLKAKGKFSTPKMMLPLMLLVQVYFFARTAAVFVSVNRRLPAEKVQSKLRRSKQLIKGVLFDVDGTLYHQFPLRIMIILSLIASHLFSPVELIRKIRVILAYRRSHEKIRAAPTPFINGTDHLQFRGKVINISDTDLQIQLTARAIGFSPQYIKQVVGEWFEQKPMVFLPFCKKKDLTLVLRTLELKGIPMGVFSDYPVEAKLESLGIERFFDVILSASDHQVHGIKPCTDGFDIAAKRMGIHPWKILYVGDREDVDGKGAASAGMNVLIINSPWKKRGFDTYHRISKLTDILNYV